MNELRLNRRLGIAGSHAFQRVQYERLLHALSPQQSINFVQRIHGGSNFQGRSSPSGLRRQTDAFTEIPRASAVVDNGGVNVLAVDHQTGRYLISGGADSAIRIWDLELRDDAEQHDSCPVAAITRSSRGSHTHALTSLSIYPFDPVPSTLLTTSYDKTLKLFSIDTARIVPLHTFDLDDTPYTHGLSPVASSAALTAVGTAHPAVKLLDLRTGLATHTLPGHKGAVFSVCWSPRSEHLLASGATDGRVLFFDVRRAHSAFACLDHDDAIGVLRPDGTSNYQPRPALDWNAKAHNSAITGVRWADGARKLITCGHDQRIRIWDAATGRNELVHFGPRIRNERNGEFNPLASPTECGGRPGKGILLWANDDAKGEIFMMDINEGTTQKVLKTPGAAAEVEAGRGSNSSTSIGRLTGRGRINSLAWRFRTHADTGLELYSGHGDGSVHCWKGLPPEDEEVEDHADPDPGAAQKRKRKRDLLDGLVDGLTKKTLTLT